MKGALILLVCTQVSAAPVVVGSKKFTESVILGELAAQAIDDGAIHRRELGGTQILFHALERGDIDLYPEYTGTLSDEILAGLREPAAMEQALVQRGIRMTGPLGFNNTYAIGMKEELAARLTIRTLSDLVRNPQLRLGFSDEFLQRADGWPALRSRYGLPQTDVRGLDHDLAYRALDRGALDAIDLYSTDAEIRAYRLRVLLDDRGIFPRYEAVFIYRADLTKRAPDAARALQTLVGRLDESTMIGLNARAKLEHVTEKRVAHEFLAPGTPLATEPSRLAELGHHTRDHLWLFALSLSLAILIAVPLGISAARFPRFGQLVLATVGIVQTVPSLALLVFMIPLLGIGAPPAIAALFFYSLLPIVRNTYTGLRTIPPELIESAEALGLPRRQRLFWIELPLASRTLVAGIKTAAVINVGTATLGAIIGAGGYGQPILTGIRRDDWAEILSGAIPAALLAIAVQGLFELVERRIVPRGLR